MKAAKEEEFKALEAKMVIDTKSKQFESKEKKEKSALKLKKNRLILYQNMSKSKYVEESLLLALLLQSIKNF